MIDVRFVQSLKAENLKSSIDKHCDKSIDVNPLQFSKAFCPIDLREVHLDKSIMETPI